MMTSCNCRPICKGITPETLNIDQVGVIRGEAAEQNTSVYFNTPRQN